MFATVMVNGKQQLWEGCRVCQKPVRGGHYLSHHATTGTVEVIEDRRSLNPPCVVCGELGTELHHWAPRTIFGQFEADRWPTSYLCLVCHNEWHKRTGVAV